MAQITEIRPMLAVTDLRRTIEFYSTKLGFTCGETFGDPPAWCDLSRDGWGIMFNAPPVDDVLRDVSRRSRDYQIFYFTPMTWSHSATNLSHAVLRLQISALQFMA